jgi:hypothetical protein
MKDRAVAPAATLEPMATRRDPDIIALEQDGTFCLSPPSERAREWLAANADGKRDGACVLVPRPGRAPHRGHAKARGCG